MTTTASIQALSLEDCERWNASNKQVNPITGRALKQGSDIWRRIEKQCNTIGVSPTVAVTTTNIAGITEKHCEEWKLNLKVNPLTKGKLLKKSDEYKNIKNECFNRYGLKDTDWSEDIVKAITSNNASRVSHILSLHNSVTKYMKLRPALTEQRYIVMNGASSFTTVIIYAVKKGHYDVLKELFKAENAFYGDVKYYNEPTILLKHTLRAATEGTTAHHKLMDLLFEMYDAKHAATSTNIPNNSPRAEIMTALMSRSGYDDFKRLYPVWKASPQYIPLVREALFKSNEKIASFLLRQGEGLPDITSFKNYSMFEQIAPIWFNVWLQDPKTDIMQVRDFVEKLMSNNVTPPKVIVKQMAKWPKDQGGADVWKRLLYFMFFQGMTVKDPAAHEIDDDDHEYARLISANKGDKDAMLRDVSNMTVRFVKVTQGTGVDVYRIDIVHMKYNVPIANLGYYANVFTLPDVLPSSITIPKYMKDVKSFQSVLQQALNNGQLLMPTLPILPTVQSRLLEALDVGVSSLYSDALENRVKNMSVKVIKEGALEFVVAACDLIKPLSGVTAPLPNDRGARFKKYYLSDAHYAHIIDVFRKVIEDKESPKKTPTKFSPTTTQAASKITVYAKKRMNKLEEYYHESVRYMLSLPANIRQSLLDSVSGVIMQGPYSPIKRIGTLLYANAKSTRATLDMLEVVSRAPRFPMRQSMFRGMTIIPSPKEGDVITQVLPFSTTFLSSYAVGWIYAKRNVSCCIFQLRCHTGTGGLFVSKLPWHQPWTPHNRSVYKSIFGSVNGRTYHEKVNAQNEFIMAPYRLRVKHIRKKQLGDLLDKQRELYDTHYQLDATNRNMGILNEDVLKQEIDVYEVDLEPITVYAVKLAPNAIQYFNPSLFYQNAQLSWSDLQHTDTIFFSPEETHPTILQRIESACAAGHGVKTVIIDKGRYVGEKTF